MKLIKIGFGWKLVLTTMILAIFVLGVTIDIVVNWDTKAEVSSELLLFGTGLYTLLVIGLTSHAATTIVSFLGIITLIAIGSTSSTLYNSRYNHSQNKTCTHHVPWEFYLIIAVSVIILILAIVWSLYKTKKGKAILQSGKAMMKKIKSKRATSKKIHK